MSCNKLAQESSPYLLQHVDNPVCWYPWGDEAFQAAKDQDKPIFLSIGYATCHWCHVMAHESFEDEAVAALMNEHFINIKVDREERPDIDHVYMQVCQMITGSGGWPLTVMMTPEKRPFFVATYLPKSSRFGRKGMMELIPEIGQVWKNQRDKVEASADNVVNHLGNVIKIEAGGEVGQGHLNKAFLQLQQNFDSLNGGFGSKPKFPMPHNLQFLLRFAHRRGENIASDMVFKTLIEMRLGGIFDHVGFGFHRYATDEGWLLPHFEKMLYDQALLMMAYTEAWQVNQHPLFKQTVDEIVTYILRDMTDSAGGFYSAEDADSEGEEGLFYIWDQTELADIVGEKEARWIYERFNTTPAGNFEDEATQEKNGLNILHLTTPLSADEQVRWDNLRESLFVLRETRIHPLKDDKVLADWNGLMISALAKASRVFGRLDFARVAIKAADFILTEMCDAETGKLWHRYRKGAPAGLQANVDDYAFMIAGLIDLWETTFDPRWLIEAEKLQAYLDQYFRDEAAAGYYFTPAGGEELLVRQKVVQDSAVPAANSISVQNLLKLSQLTGKTDYAIGADQISTMSADVREYPAGFTALLAGVDAGLGPAAEIVIAGDRNDPETQALLAGVQSRFLPGSVVMLIDEKNRKQITEIAPFTEYQLPIAGRPAVYVCKGQQCERPVTTVAELTVILDKFQQRK